MADFQSRIHLDIDSAAAVAAINELQQRISAFHTQMAKGGAVANSELAKMRSNLVSTINATGSWRAGMTTVASATDSFTTALEKNKLTMGETFRYSMASTKTFGRFFKTEMDTVNKVARERTKDIQTQYIKMGRNINGVMQAIKVRPLTLDLADMNTQAMISAQRMQVFNKLIDHGSTQLLNFGKNTQWAGRQLMVGFTVPLMMLGSVASRTFMDMEKEIIKLKRVYGDFSTTVEDTDKMVSSIKTLAVEFTKYGVAVKDTFSLAAEAAAAGNTGADLINQVTEATRLAVLGGIDQQKAYETTISVTNAFGIATDKLAGKIDFLNAVENQTVTSIDDLTTAIPKAAPVIQQLGGGVEDLAFFLTAMKEGGINASEGANALKSGLASMINPTQKASDMLMGMGINLKQIVSQDAGNVRKMVIDFASALNELDPLSRAQAIEQLFGKFQFARISTLFKNVTDEGSQANKVLMLSNATAQQLAVLSKRELGKVQESTTYKFQAAWEKLKTSIAPVGEQFLKALTPLLDFGTRLLNQFNNWSEGSKNFAIGLTTALGVVGPTVLMAIGLVSNGIANLVKFFHFLARSFTGASRDSKVLGMETRYMTQAQLDAAAQAASLGQSHSKLTQVYTSETAALNALISALSRATVAQAKFGAAGGGSLTRGKAKKYAKGVTMVPGQEGAGDVVPAMLAPGEAVIPAKHAKKYSGLINGMVAGNIPGYETGRKVLAPKNIQQTESTHYTDPTETAKRYTVKAATEEFLRGQQSLVDAGHISPEEMAQREAAWKQQITKYGNAKKGVGLANSQTVSVGKSINQAFNQNKAVTGKEIHQSLQTEGANSAMRSQYAQLRGMGMDEASAKKFIQVAFKEVSSEFEKTMDKAFDEKKFAAAVEKGMDRAFKKAAAAEKNKSKAQLLTRAQAEAKVTTGFKSKAEHLGPSSSPTRYYVAGPNPQRPSSKYMGELGVSEAKNSMGVTQELVNELKKNKQVGKGATIETVQQEMKALVADLEKQSPAKAEAAWRKLSEGTIAQRAKGIADVKAGNFGAGKSTGKAKPAAKKPTTASKPKLEGFVYDEKAEKWIDQHGNQYDPKTKKYTNAAGEKLSMAQVAENRAVASSPTRGSKMGGGKIGGLVAGGAVAAAGLGMGGGIDQMIGPVMMATMLPQMMGKFGAKFATPITAGFVALMALVEGISIFKKRMDEATKSGLQMGAALASTNKDLISMSEQLGTVSATEARQFGQDALVAGVGDKAQLTEGEKIIKSDIGKSIVSGLSESLKNGLNTDFIGKSLGAKLSTMISEGVMSPEQARSFAYAIGKELGNARLGATIKLTVDQIVGPNGEKLEQDPLGVVLKIQGVQMDQFNTVAGLAGGAKTTANVHTGADAALGGFGAWRAQAGTGMIMRSGVPGKIAAGLGNDALAGTFDKMGAKLGGKLAEKIIGTVAKKFASATAKVAIGAALGETVVGTVAMWSWAIWDVVSGVWDISVAIKDYAKQQEHVNKLTSVAMQLGIQQIAQNQQLLDSLNAQYDSKEAELRSQIQSATSTEERIKLEKDLNTLLEKRKTDVEAFNKSSAAGYDQVVNFAMKDMGKFTNTKDGIASKQIATTYKDNPLMGEAANAALETVDSLNNSKFKASLAIQLSAGTMDPFVVESIAQAAKSGVPIEAQFDALVDVRGSAETNTILQLLNKAGTAPEELPVMLNIMKTGDIDALATIASLRGDYGIDINLNVKNLDKAKAASDMLANTGDVITKTVMLSIDDQSGGKFNQITQNWDSIAGADQVLSKTATVQLKLIMDNPQIVANWAKASGKNVTGMDANAIMTQYFSEYVNSMGFDQPMNIGPLSVAGYKTVTTSGGGGGSGEDPKLQALLDKQDKRQKALDVIAIREDRINKAYDERKKALEEIAKAQSTITEQQKNQMDLADALSRGDIAAAARAAQAVQAKSAELAIAKQQDDLEQSRQNALKEVSFRGMDRSGLEAELDKLKEQIAIREYELSPKKNGGGGGGTTTKQVKTDKPTAPPAGLEGTQGEWVWNASAGTWDWKPSEVAIGKTSAPISTKPIQPGGGGNWWENLFSGFGKWWDDMLKNIGSWWDSLVNSPWMKSIAAIFIGTYNVFIKPLVDGLIDGINKATTWISEQWNNMVTSISTWWDTNVSQPMDEFFGQVNGWIDTNISQPWNEMVTNISGWWDQNISQPINDFFTQVGGWIDTNITQPFNDAITWVQEQFGGFFSWFFEDDTLENKIKDVENWWHNVIDNVQKWWDGILQWFRDLPANIAAIGADMWSGIQDAGAWLGQQWDKFVNWFTVDLPTGISNWGSDIWSSMQDANDWLGQQWENFVTWFTVDLPNGISQWGADVWSSMQGVDDWLGEQWNNLVTWFTVDLPNGIAQWGSDMWNNIQKFPDWLNQQWNSVVDWFKDLPHKIAYTMGYLWEEVVMFTEWLGDQWGGIAEWFAGLGPAIAEWASGIWDNMQDIGAWLGEQWNNLVSWFEGLGPAIAEWASGIWDNMQDVGAWLGEQWDKMVSWFEGLPAAVAEWASGIWDGIVDIGAWLGEQWDNLAAWFASLPNTIAQWASDIWSGMQDIGEWLGTQWDNFMNWLTVTLPTAIAEWGASIWNGMQDIGEWLTTQWNNFMTWLTVTLPNSIALWGMSIWQGMQDIGAWLTTQWNSFMTWLTVTLPTSIAEWGASIWQGMQDIGAWLATQWDNFMIWLTVTLPTAIAGWGASIWQGMQSIGSWLAQQWNSFMTWLTVTLPTAIAGWGASIWSGMQSIGSWLSTQYSKFSTWLTKDVPAAVAKWGADVWKNMGDMTAFLTKKAEEIKNWILGLPNKIANWAKGVWDGFWNSFSQGQRDARNGSGYNPNKHTGGSIRRHTGGAIYRSFGGDVPGSGNMDSVSAMLTPGEFVINKNAVANYGVENLRKINNNSGSDLGSVYNYSVTVNAATNANPDEIAQTVVRKLQGIESQRIGGR